MRERVTLKYNFDRSEPLKGERHSHRIGGGCGRIVPKKTILETIRSKDEQLIKLREVFG